MGSLEQGARHWHYRGKEPTGSLQKIPSPQPVPCSMGAGGRTVSSGKHPVSFFPPHPFLCGAGAASCSLHHPLIHLSPTSLRHFSGSLQCSLSSPSLLGSWLSSQADLSHLAPFITPKLSNPLLYWDLPKQIETPLPCLTLTLKDPEHPVPARPLAAPRCWFAQGSFSSMALAASPAPTCSEQHLAHGAVAEQCL